MYTYTYVVVIDFVTEKNQLLDFGWEWITDLSFGSPEPHCAI